MTPLPAPPTTPLVYVKPTPPNELTIQLAHTRQGEDSTTVVSCALNGRLARVAVLTGGSRRTRHAVRHIIREFIAHAKPTRYCRITVNDPAAAYMVARSAAETVGHEVNTLVVRRTTDHGHPLLVHPTRRSAPVLTGTTTHGTPYRRVADRDVPAQVVIHTDASRRANLGMGWVIESVRLAEPMHGSATVPHLAVDGTDYNVLYAELLAIRHAVTDALEVFPVNGITQTRPVYVYTDSRQAVEFLKRHHRRERFGEQMTELWEWWKQLRRDRPHTDVVWIRGHNRNPGNVEADRLARSAAAQSLISCYQRGDENRGAPEGRTP